MPRSFFLAYTLSSQSWSTLVLAWQVF